MESIKVKKKIILWCGLLLSVCISGCSSEETTKNETAETTQTEVVDYHDLEEVVTICDQAQFEYDDLSEYAQLIAKVVVMDDLTQANSIPFYEDEEKEYLSTAVAKRKVKVLEYYKNENNCEDMELEVLEGAAVIDHQYIHDEGYEPLEKGQTYILYMSNRTASGEYSIISGLNSVVKLEDPFEHMEYSDVVFKTLVEYESDLSEKEKQGFLDKEVSIIGNDEKDKAEILVFNVSTDKKDVEIEYIETKKEIKIIGEN